MSSNYQVSEREREILKLIATGATNQQIANALDISVNTVKVHLRNIFAKIGVASRAEAAMYAVRVGLVSLGDAPAATVTVAVQDAVPEDEPSDGPAAAGPDPGATLVVVDQPAPSVVPARRSAVAIARETIPALVLIAASVLFIAAIAIAAPRTGITPPPAAPATASDPQRWSQLPSLPVGLAGFGLASHSYEGRSFLYVLGGDPGTGASDGVLRYDLSSSVWAPMSRKPTAATDVRAAVIGGLVYVPGGRSPSGTVAATLEAYDPQRDSWRALAPMPEPRCAYVLAVVEGKLYVIGGWDGAKHRSEVWQYSPDDDTWRARSPMPTARSHAAAAVVEQAVLVVGGEGVGGTLAAVERYSPAADRTGSVAWSTQAPAPVPTSHVDAGAAGGLVVVMAADRGGGRLLAYNVQTDVWNSSALPIAGLPDARVQAVGGRLYIVGGRSEGKASDRLLQYQVLTSVFLPSLP